MSRSIEKSLAESASYLARRMEFWAENKEFLTPIVNHFENLGHTADTSTYCLDLSVVGGMGDLLGAIARLEQDGYTTAKELPEKTEGYWSAGFFAEDKPKIQLYFSNARCEKVQVGTQMVEQPIYEVRCSDVTE